MDQNAVTNGCFRLCCKVTGSFFFFERIAGPVPITLTRSVSSEQLAVLPHHPKFLRFSSATARRESWSLQCRNHHHRLTTFISPGAQLGTPSAAAAFEGQPKIAFNAVPLTPIIAPHLARFLLGPATAQSKHATTLGSRFGVRIQT